MCYVNILLSKNGIKQLQVKPIFDLFSFDQLVSEYE